MTTVALRGLAARRLRTALTAIAVLLGVAMVAGTYIETDQIRNAFKGITKQSVAGIDVVVTPRESFTGMTMSEPQMLDSSLTRRVAGVEGVEAAEGQVATFGQIIVDGEPVETMGAPPLVMADATDRFDPSETVAGRDPQYPAEATVLEQNAEDHGIEIGDEIGVATRHGVKQVSVVGIFAFGEGGSSLGGTTAIELTRAQVSSWFDLQGKVSTISVLAQPGVDPASLSKRIKAALPRSARSQTADENAEESADEINDQIDSFLTPALLALAGAALLVGAFIIFNTFSITVAQRTKEFALLRALGATRAQLLRSVTTEALLIGVVASLAGLGAGIGFSKLLNALFDAVGFGIPRSGLILATRTIVLALAVGIGVTLIAAIVPAFRATRVAPVRAMAGGAAAPSSRRRRLAMAGSAVLLAAGALLIAQGLFGDGSATSKLGAVGGGSVIVFVGVALATRYIVRPLARVIGYPIERAFKTPGRLARENAARNPARTAVTSAALMVGLGLVVFVAVFAAGLKGSIAGQLDDLVRAELVIYGQGFQPFSSRARDVVDGVSGVEAAVPQLFDQMEVNGEKSNAATDILIGIEPDKLSAVYEFDWLEGDDATLTGLGPNEAVIEEQFAKQHGIDVGDSYEVETPSGGKATIRAVGEYRDPTVLQGTLADLPTLQAISPVRDPVALLVAIDDSADPKTVENAIQDALAGPFPTLKVENKEEYRQTISDQLNQIIYMLYALLAMSVVISLFGIANSLFLSIHERTGEFGVLRAIGTTAEQLRRVIRYESVITSVIGGVLGMALGVSFAAVMIASLSEFGLSVSIPVLQLLAFFVLSVLVGLAGAVAPARRASHVNVLAAIHHD